VLFSYYSIIGLAVLAIAFKKYWRYLNRVSFIFTFAVLGYWCVERSIPEQFIYLEIFLVGFFLIFTAVNILASLRQTDYAIIENAYALTLSFTYITLQMITAQLYQYGQAIASLTLGIFYIALSSWLLKRYKKQLKQLVQLYLALGIVFVNFALPFALEGDWTAGIWAVEGAALVVLGVHQSNRLFQYFGTTLTLLAMCLGFDMQQAADAIFFINNVWLVRIMAAVSLIVGACAYNKRVSGKLVTAYSALAYLSLGMGLLLWYANFWQELWRLERHAASTWLLLPMLALALASLSALVFNYIACKVRWPHLRWIAATPLAVALCLTLFGGISYYYMSQHSIFYPHTLSLWYGGLIGWIPFLTSSVVFIRQYYLKGKALPEKLSAVLATAFIFVLAILISTNIAYLIGITMPAIVSTALILWLTSSRYSLRIPLLRGYRFVAALPIAAYLLAYVLAMPFFGPALPFFEYT
jgi:hypothetical protein